MERRPGCGCLVDYLAVQRDALSHAYPGVRSGDADSVHDMRVAARRLRATLRTFRGLLPAATAQSLQDDLRWIGELLGTVRDADVMAQRLADAIAAEPTELIVGPVAARIRQRQAASGAPARAELAAALDSARLATLLETIGDLVDTQPRTATGRQLRRRARRALLRADRRLDAAQQRGAQQHGVQQHEAGPTSSAIARDVALHEARKAFKRARYAVEVLVPLDGAKARRLAKRLRILQDALGGYQDAVVTAHLLRDYGMRAYLDGENAFSYGLLLARQHAIGERDLSQLDRAWRRASRPGIRAWLS